jgi:hypothetical protein
MLWHESKQNLPLAIIDQLKQEHVAALARITELETQLVHAEKKSEHVEE